MDVREEMEPHPCFDFLVWFDPEKLTRRSVFLNVLRYADKLVCSPAGIAFVSEENRMDSHASFFYVFCCKVQSAIKTEKDT